MAGEVSPERAYNIARCAFQRGGGARMSISQPKLLWDSSALFASTRADAAPSFYLFGKGDGEGFVVVAGDDALIPVLAYSEHGVAPRAESLSASMRWWFGYVDGVVGEVRRRVAGGERVVSREGDDVQNVGLNARVIETARWSQDAPYNLECPYDGSAQSVTGCAITATAIIMKYYNWPAAAVGYTEPFVTPTKGISVEARDLNHSYDWDAMLMEYAKGEYSEEQGKAVATLMADLGYAYKADYGAEGTAAMPSQEALFHNFGYSPATYIYIRDYYSVRYWEELMRTEIDALRPIYYVGYDENGFGHAFVIDGYADDGYFRVNWGWGGLGDGFFRLNDMTIGEYLLNVDQWALLGLTPRRTADVEGVLQCYSTGIDISEEEIVTGRPFMVNSLYYANYSLAEFRGVIRLAHVDIDGQHKGWVSEELACEVQPYYYSSMSNIECVVTESIEPGDRLRAFYRGEGMEEWHIMMPHQEHDVWERILRQSPIGDLTSLRYDDVERRLYIDFEADVEAVLLKDGVVVESGVTIEEGRMTIDVDSLDDSKYSVRLQREAESYEFSFSIGSL